MAIPIPHRPSGFLLGDPAALVTLAAFIDIQCPHSRAAWPTLMAVMALYQLKLVLVKVMTLWPINLRH